VLSGDALGDLRRPPPPPCARASAAHHIADRPHLRQVRPALVVDDDEAALVERQADGRGVETRRVRRRPIDTMSRSNVTDCAVPAASV